MTLGEFLKAKLADRGPWNCSTLPADWCIALGYRDFAAPWRRVVDPLECERATQEAGLAQLWGDSIGRDLPLVDGELQAGDVGIVQYLAFEAGAIWTGARWALRAKAGLHFANIDRVALVAAWRP